MNFEPSSFDLKYETEPYRKVTNALMSERACPHNPALTASRTKVTSFEYTRNFNSPDLASVFVRKSDALNTLRATHVTKNAVFI